MMTFLCSENFLISLSVEPNYTLAGLIVYTEADYDDGAIIRMVQDIPLAFRPPTVRHAVYGIVQQK